MLQLPDIEDDVLSKYVSEQLLKIIEKDKEPLDHFPLDTDERTAKYERESLIKLLKAKKCYIPEMIQEYYMFSVICEATEMGYELDPLTESVELDGYIDEEVVEAFQDIEEWQEVLFWDWDFMFLSGMTEEELLNSPLSAGLGIGSPNEHIIDMDGRSVKIKMREWEMEE